jgi:hypothetical protein
MLAIILGIIPRGQPVKDGFLDGVDQADPNVIRFIWGEA